MQILGEIAFIALLAAVGYELYRWFMGGRLRYRRLISARGTRPEVRPPHLPAAARSFVGAGPSDGGSVRSETESTDEMPQFAQRLP
ncbi:MAG TPA: hypothetical protein VE889_06390 [Actinomycetota bacterium]|jgi:hypothetical protein|nr:hypothetical protein [Actinomycetota bacterium]